MGSPGNCTLAGHCRTDYSYYGNELVTVSVSCGEGRLPRYGYISEEEVSRSLERKRKTPPDGGATRLQTPSVKSGLKPLYSKQPCRAAICKVVSGRRAAILVEV